MNSRATTSTTSSPGLRAGPSPCDSPGGTQLDLFGPAPAPAPRSRRRGGRSANSAAEKSGSSATSSAACPAPGGTSGTSGPSSEGSSPSACLQRSLANRLRRRMAASGSPEFVLTWKHWDMPSGPPICALRARGRRAKDGLCVAAWPLSSRASSEPPTSGSGCSGLPLGPWPTPMAGSPGTGEYNAAGNTDSSRRTVALAGWATPQTADVNLSRGSAGYAERKLEGSPYPSLALQATLAGWATPTASDAGSARNETSGRKEGSRHHSGQTLHDQVRDMPTLAGWATPTSRDGKDGQCEAADVPTNALLGRQAVRLPAEGAGPTSTPSPAGTERRGESRGSLNPAFSGWLMGFPAAWLLCGLRAWAASRSRGARSPGGPACSGGSATPSSSRSRRSSSRRSSGRRAT